MKWLAPAVLALGLGACRDSLVSPRSPAELRTGGAPMTPRPEPGEQPASDFTAQVPVISRLHGEIRDGRFVLTGALRPRDPGVSMFYDPDRPGGWALQLFVDSQATNAGYWLGYDYIVRGVEWSRQDGTFVVRRITLDPATPGGWGPVSGTATFSVTRGNFEITVPLESLGEPDAGLNFALETYATVECPECEAGAAQCYVEDYFGASNVAALARGGRDLEPARPVRLLGATRHGTEPDPRLFAAASPSR